MEVNSEALAAALKMAGQNTAELDKTIRTIKMVNTIQQQGATPDAVMALLAQYNPKYAAMAALLKALNATNTTQGDKPYKGDDIQYNHF